MDIECSKCGRHFSEGTPESVIKAHYELHNRESFNKPSKIPNIFENVIFPQFDNPLFVTVKMLLADKRSWVKEYREDEYDCKDFSRDVVDFMTNREIRCGYTIIRFDNDMGHAIVAFETDYGLVYFEPQSGNQEYPEIGKLYRGTLKGVPENSLVTNIEIKWNC